MLKKVVLPAPLGPIRLTIEPRGTTKSTSLTATRPPNSLRIWFTSSSSPVPAAVLPEVVAVSLMGDVVERLVVDALVQLGRASRTGYQPLRPQEHHEHEDDPEDPELVLRHVQV